MQNNSLKNSQFCRALLSLLILTVTFCGQPVFGQESLRPKLLGTIPIGTKPGQLAFTVKNQEMRSWVPSSFSFTPAGLLTIHDAGNYRIEYFDPETLAFKSSEPANFSASTDYVYYGKNVMWDVNYNYTKLNVPNKSDIVELDNSNGYPFAYRDGFLWFSTSDMRIFAYDESGKLTENNQAISLLIKMNAKYLADTTIKPAVSKIVRSRILSGKALIIDGKIVPRSFSEAAEYSRLLNPADVDHPDNRVAGGLIQEGASGTWGYGNNVAADGTTYWVMPSSEKEGINPKDLYFCAYSNTGKLLAYVNIARGMDLAEITEKKKASHSLLAEGVPYSHPLLIEVSPRGDIYILAAFFDEVQIYRVERVW